VANRFGLRLLHRLAASISINQRISFAREPWPWSGPPAGARRAGHDSRAQVHRPKRTRISGCDDAECGKKPVPHLRSSVSHARSRLNQWLNPSPVFCVGLQTTSSLPIRNRGGAGIHPPRRPSTGRACAAHSRWSACAPREKHVRPRSVIGENSRPRPPAALG